MKFEKIGEAASLKFQSKLAFACTCTDFEQSVSSIAGLEDGSALYAASGLIGGGGDTPPLGKRHKKSHGLCPRCGKRSYHLQDCSAEH